MIAASSTNLDVCSFRPARSTERKLSLGEVHVWAGNISLRHHRPGDLATLSVLERGRADRYYSGTRRHRWIEGRAWLRRVLASYLACDPAEVPLVHDENGKPQVRDPAKSLFFNYTRSGRSALVAVARSDVGIDLESSSRAHVTSNLLRRTSSPIEWRILEAAGPAARRELFLKLWTRKEALLKATGVGLSQEPSLMTVLAEGESPGETRAFRIAGAPVQYRTLELFDLSPGPGSFAAVAIRERSSRVRARLWPAS